MDLMKYLISYRYKKIKKIVKNKGVTTTPPNGVYVTRDKMRCFNESCKG